MDTFSFRDLVGVRGTLKGPIVQSKTRAAAGLRKFRIVSAAGDYGAVNLYKDDSGKYRGERCEFMRTAESRIFETKKAALPWFADQILICRNGVR